jgi:AmiR/NasT family two-component response regulator
MEIRKSILIIKSPSGAKSIVAAETFLRNREWVVASTTNIKDALTYVIHHKPSFVLIAVDHPTKKIRTLPKLLVSSFPVCVIAFTESSSTQTYKMLVDSGCEYRINPPLTGPAVERTVNKYLKDVEAGANEKAQVAAVVAAAKKSGLLDKRAVAKAKTLNSNTPPSKGQANGDQTSAISGSPTQNAPATLGKFDVNKTSEPGRLFDNDPAKDNSSDETLDIEAFIANQLASTLGPVAEPQRPGSFTHIEGEENSSGSEVPEFEGQQVAEQAAALYNTETAKGIEGTAEEADSLGASLLSIDQSGKVQAPGMAYAGNLGETPQNSEPGTPGYFPDQGSEGSQQNQQQQAKGPSIYVPPENNNKPKNEFEPLSPTGASAPTLFGKKKAQNQGHVPVYNEDDVSPTNESSNSSGSEAPLLNFDPKVSQEGGKIFAKEVEHVSKPKKNNTRDTLNREVHRVGGKHKGWEKSESALSKGTQKALDESVADKDEDIKQAIQESSNVACIVVESPRFSGYLVAAMGKNRKIDKSFIDGIKDRLLKFLKEQGETMTDEEGIEIKIKQVDFEDWALEYADFLRKSVHNGDEVAMAFFPFAEAKTSFGDSPSAEMGAVKVDDLHGDLEIDFNLYIYLPANNRYVLYTPKGSKFYSNQKNRLQTMGVTHLHMRKSEAQDLSKYRAQNYLNNKIEEYERKKRTRKIA